MNPRQQRTLEVVSVIGLTAAFTALYIRMQPQILAGNGYGWDGIEYSKIFRNFLAGGDERVEFPFCNRVGTPILAGLTGIENPFLAFKAVNIVFALLFCLANYAIVRTAGFNYYHGLFALLLTVIPAYAPLRFTPFYPVYTDPPFIALLSLAFLCLLKRWFGLAFVLVACAYPFREAALYVAPLFLGFALFLGGGTRPTLAGFAATCGGILAMKLWITGTLDCQGSHLKTALTWARQGFSDPQRFVGYMAGLSMTAAPVIYIRSIGRLSKIEEISVIGFLAAAVLAFLGGSDVTRIFYSFFPLYIILIMAAIRARGILFSLVCLLGYMVTNRFGSKMLEPLNYWPSRDESGLFWQFPDQARPEVSMMILFVWIGVFICFDKLAGKPGKSGARISRRAPA